MTEDKEKVVRKRDGTTEPLNYDKIHKMLEYCSDGLNVSISETAINAHIKITNKISSADIQQTLIKSAAEKISVEEPDYDIFAGRLLMTDMRKEVYQDIHPTNFLEYIKSRVDRKLYSPDILKKYTEDEITNLGTFLDYSNDMNRGDATGNVYDHSYGYLCRRRTEPSATGPRFLFGIKE